MFLIWNKSGCFNTTSIIRQNWADNQCDWQCSFIHDTRTYATCLMDKIKQLNINILLLIGSIMCRYWRYWVSNRESKSQKANDGLKVGNPSYLETGFDTCRISISSQLWSTDYGGANGDDATASNQWPGLDCAAPLRLAEPGGTNRTGKIYFHISLSNFLRAQ